VNYGCFNRRRGGLFNKRGNDIVIAKAISMPTNAPADLGDGLHLVEVNVMRTVMTVGQSGTRSRR
jgi:hypothetical protein